MTNELSPFTRDEDGRILLDINWKAEERMMCDYCQERPVFEHFTSACYKCSFTCMRCEELTGFDAGMSYDELCDDCGVAVGSTPDNPWKG